MALPTPATSRCMGCSGRGGKQVAHAATLEVPTLLTRAQTRLCLVRIMVNDGRTIVVRLQGRHIDESLPRLQARTPAFTTPPWLCIGCCMPGEHEPPVSMQAC